MKRAGEKVMKAGLRIDVDTLRGTRWGVPRLLSILAQERIRGSFFFSVGPDNMGRHLWRMARPAFLVKMLRTRAASLYGWDILFRGTFWPGPRIGAKLGPVIRNARDQGHEIGLHAWDHHAWQARVERMDPETVAAVLRRGFDVLKGIAGAPPVCSAAPAWRCTDQVLLAKEPFPFLYNSDCRGSSIFYPEVGGKVLSQPQVPVTLPTYDELVGREGISNDNYNDRLLERFRPNGLNVLTIHAEVEGIACAGLFTRFLAAARGRGWVFAPLGELLEETEPVRGRVVPGTVSGREGWLSCQA